MSRIYGQNWKQLLRQYGDGSPEAEVRYPPPYLGPGSPVAQGRSLVPSATPSGPRGAPPASAAGAVVPGDSGQVSGEGPETYALGSGLSDDAFSQGSWADKSTQEIRGMLRDFDPDQDDPAEYEEWLTRIVAILEVRGEPVDSRTLARFATRASYAALVVGQDTVTAGKTLRACVTELLDAQQTPADAELRVEVLMGLLTSYGGGGGGARVSPRSLGARYRDFGRRRWERVPACGLHP